MMQSALDMPGVKMGVNYGLNRVRFTSPVPVGSRLRTHQAAQGGAPGSAAECAGLVGAQSTEVTMEREGSDRPVCVAESISRRYS